MKDILMTRRTLVTNTAKLRKIMMEIEILYKEISTGETLSGGKISAHSASSHIPVTLMRIHKIGDEG